MGERAGQSGSIGKCHHSSVAQSFELELGHEHSRISAQRAVIENGNLARCTSFGRRIH